MPNRIISHLKKLDGLRDKTDEQVNDMMLKIADNIDLFLKKPKEFLRAISIEYLKKEKNTLTKAKKEGEMLRRSL